MTQSNVPPMPPPPPSKVAQPGKERKRERSRDSMPLLHLVRLAHEKGFSDIHLGVGKMPYFRHRGQMVRTDYPVTTEAVFYSWMGEIFRDEDVRKFQAELDFDGAAQYDFTRVRVNAFMSLQGPAMVLRLIPMKIKSLDDLGFPEVLKTLSMEYGQGLILVTGPTGSGKSTTLAAMIDYVNRTQAKHIVTVEDPIEFVHRNHRSLINQREVGIHTTEFERALRAVLREDPDVILIGEMRDRITVDTALKASQTGHLVLGTLHTNSAVATIERLLNIYDPAEQDVMRFQVAEALVAVVAQVLVPTTDGKRTAAQEIMLNTDAIKDWIQRGEIDEIQDIIARSGYYGMQSMNQALYELYEYGKITEEIALSSSPEPNDMGLRLKGVDMA
ncbi:MAG: PilT/PilU family type 4a pilus ATPase [Cyanothece sp. SIO2G6]|nr:PilT/PilU family type 4a pilus ATPase [Cyanothece sp. SIO2G6]